MPHHVFRTLVAAVTTTAVVATGCAGGRPWPTGPVALSTKFATTGRIVTIDILPPDLQLWAEPGDQDDVDVDAVRGAAEVNLMDITLKTLALRNYSFGATIDWNGNYPGGNALSPEALQATVGALAHYGAAAAQHPGQLPVPFLPARLGTATGADATLYLGGWAYVARHRDSTADDIIKGIAIGLAIITVIAIIAIIASDGHGGHGSSGHSGGGHGGSFAGGIARHGFTASRGVDLHRGLRGGARAVDAFGRAAIDIALQTPVWGEDPALPDNGGESQMYLEMTLVDNRTGFALWHAHQLFPASAADPGETARAARTMLARLPVRTAATRGE